MVSKLYKRYLASKPMVPFSIQTLLNSVLIWCENNEAYSFLRVRFPFPNLTPHLGRSLRILALPALFPTEGAMLLKVLAVDGPASIREAASLRLEGHPLALRLFARAVQQQADGDPTRKIEIAIRATGLSDEDTLERKIKRLLLFYERTLTSEQVNMLSIIALFSYEVSLYEITQLMNSDKITADGKAYRDYEIAECARSLREHGLVLSSHDGSSLSCHPIVRDHFRSKVLQQAGEAAAVLLTSRPGSAQIASAEHCRPIVNAVQ